jgi:two-component system uhpT operon response regulator UhpA
MPDRNAHDCAGNLIRTVIVDDSAFFCEAISRFLQSLPLIEEIGSALSSSRGLALVAEQQPDLVLLDLEMPGANGLEVLERLRPASPGTRVVIVTIHDGDTVRTECLARGADGFVSKNRLRDELPGVIRQLFQEKFAASGPKPMRLPKLPCP